MMLIDAHTHLGNFGSNLTRALEIINDKKIWTLACSMDKADYLWLKKIAKDQPYVIPCYGIHPWKISPDLEELKNKDEMEKYIRETPIIGEIGLDFFWSEDEASYPLQLEVLHFFFQQAKTYNKIVNLHTKGAEKEVLELLRKYQLKTPIIHWYSGPLDLVEDFLKLDCYWTVSVDVIESEVTRKLVSKLPLDRILTETDGPTALEWVNGGYAYPDYVEKIVKEIAIIKNIDYEICRNRINKNFESLLSSTDTSIELE